jgi:hypothetical protein
LVKGKKNEEKGKQEGGEEKRGKGKRQRRGVLMSRESIEMSFYVKFL